MNLKGPQIGDGHRVPCISSGLTRVFTVARMGVPKRTDMGSQKGLLRLHILLKFCLDCKSDLQSYKAMLFDEGSENVVLLGAFPMVVEPADTTRGSCCSEAAKTGRKGPQFGTALLNSEVPYSRLGFNVGSTYPIRTWNHINLS